MVSIQLPFEGVSLNTTPQLESPMQLPEPPLVVVP
jgi:hypothetical protein